ncbi:hypothetical protein AOQ84DRAFT_13379 [Glonium stellatum]|uniref:Uncharacterized protein n=1 Tax=Glonium stellatum TaxID=574774 RepID=A0A8E2EMR9_9PEZI|nr:hypothetical protein AOQ84DRAFT_13379 [Glonium stellatum]
MKHCSDQPLCNIVYFPNTKLHHLYPYRYQYQFSVSFSVILPFLTERAARIIFFRLDLHSLSLYRAPSKLSFAYCVIVYCFLSLGVEGGFREGAGDARVAEYLSG